MKHDTNKSIREYIDRRNRIINEEICPHLYAIDCTEEEAVKLLERKNKLEEEIKLKDPTYYETVNEMDK